MGGADCGGGSVGGAGSGGRSVGGAGSGGLLMSSVIVNSSFSDSYDVGNATGPPTIGGGGGPLASQWSGCGGVSSGSS